MFTRPAALQDADIVAALREHWAFDAVAVGYLAVGFGSQSTTRRRRVLTGCSNVHRSGVWPDLLGEHSESSSRWRGCRGAAGLSGTAMTGRSVPLAHPHLDVPA